MRGYLDSASHCGTPYIELALLNVLNQQGIPISCLIHTNSLARLESLEAAYLLPVSLASGLPHASLPCFFFPISCFDFWHREVMVARGQYPRPVRVARLLAPTRWTVI